MRIYFIGIGGSGIGPLALMAHEAGYDVLGSDAKDSSYVRYLQHKGIDISLDQSGDYIKKQHETKKIDWVVGVSAIVRNKPNHPELQYALKNDIKITERDALLNKIITDHELRLIAVAGTHGKTTTTAMVIWLMKQLKIDISYSVGAKLSFADMSAFDPKSKYFIYECDEFHKNFLNFRPHTAAITGIAWDHHEVFETEEDYNQSFVEFLNQSDSIMMYSDDADKIRWAENHKTKLFNKLDAEKNNIQLPGEHFRQDAWLAINTVNSYSAVEISQLVEIINRYPGSSRRMEKLANNLYSDYAHTPEKIIGCISTAKEMLKPSQKLVVIYEPLTNRRQHFIKHHYKNLFEDVDTLYWVPSYLAREDESQRVIKPEELISEMQNSHIAQAAELDNALWNKINNHISSGDFVVLISGGGGDSLDEWARKRLNT